MKKILLISLFSMGYAFAQSGELTEKEQHRLERKQRNIEKAQKRAEADGTVDDQEKHRLKRMQNRASREIYRKKHNERKR